MLSTDRKSTPINDENLKVPAAIRASAARADALHRQTYTPDPAVVTSEGNEAATPAVVTEPVPVPEPVVVAPVAQEPAGGWEHAFKSVNARYTRAAEDNRVMSDRLRSLESEVAGLRDAPPVPVPSPVESTITAQDVETFGEDFLGVVGKKAKEIYSKEVSELQAKVDRLTNQLTTVGQTVATDARSKMKQYMSSNLANWEQVNDDPEFLDWLRLPDPMSGVIRHNMLKDAWGRNEAARVLAIFNGFTASAGDSREAAVAPTTQKPVNQESAPPTQSAKPGKVPLETFAAPGRAKPAADPSGSPAEKPIITRAQITEHYRDSASGKYRGRETEYQAFEKAIELAGKEGRIR